MKWRMTPRRLPRPQPSVQLVRLVVVEAGAHVSGLRLAPDGDGDEDTVVVRQMDGGPSSVLAARAIARLALIERSGSAVQRAVMLIAPRRDGQSMAARHLLARALLTHAHVNHEPTRHSVTSSWLWWSCSWGRREARSCPSVSSSAHQRSLPGERHDRAESLRARRPMT
jgi:hypothetical protein